MSNMESGDLKSEILKNLNPAQNEAVCWTHQPLLVLAGAGSGKTRILTRRIAYLIAEGVHPFHILGVTFTNKAAGEMKARVQKMIQQDVWISTFHSTCLRILRMDGPAIGIDKRFQVYDEQDQLTLIKECIRELNINEKQVHPKAVRERIQRAKDVLITPYQYLEKSPDIFEETVGKIYELYEKKCEQLKACDFGDLIMKTVLLFDKRGDILASWQDRFQHILIDEYQDTNHAQYRLVKLLADKTRQITVVGDPDQSIYAWRGADIRNILNFEQDYPECGIIRMEQNYRSTQTILNAANELIKRNQMRKPKSLWTERDEGDEISVCEMVNEKEEAMQIVRWANAYVSRGRTLADQVVFYRVHAQSRVIEDALRRANIPYKIVGGTRFYDRKEIKDMVAFLRVIAYPHDEINMRRIMNVPSRGIGKKAMERIETFMREHQCSLDEAMGRVKEIPELMPKVRAAIERFHHLLQGWRQKSGQLSLHELMQQILEKTGYVLALEAEKTIEAQARIENIEEFFSVIEDFEEQWTNTEQPVLEAFLESISLMSDVDTFQEGTNVLTLMTFNTAKGLEFPIVYMVGMEEGIFPNVKTYSDDYEDLEEERRLCYVGITRAQDKLHFTYTRERRLYGSSQFNLPSRFLNEIPSELMKSRGDLTVEKDPRTEFQDDDDFIDINLIDVRRRILFD